MGFVKDTFDAITGRGAEKASRQAASTSAQAQQNALNYLREQEEIPSQYRESSLGLMGGLFGLNQPDPNAPPRPTFQPPETSGFGGMVGGAMQSAANNVARQKYEQELADWESQYGSGSASSGPSQQQALQQFQNNPIFQATIGQLPQQEEAILRNQSATGALRGGGTDMMLAENQRNNQLQAFQNTLGGLQNLAGLQSYAPQIAQGMSGIGNTLAQGQVAGANARQQGIGQTLGLGMNALSLAGFSDARLKDNVKPAGERYGHNWFTWDWNDKAKELGLEGSSEGVMAHEVARKHPQWVGTSQGYLTVNYRALEATNG